MHATEFLLPLISLAAEILRPLKITRLAEFPQPLITRPAEIPQLLITDGAEILQPLIDSCSRMSAEFLSYKVSIKISKYSCLI